MVGSMIAKVNSVIFQDILKNINTSINSDEPQVVNIDIDTQRSASKQKPLGVGTKRGILKNSNMNSSPHIKLHQTSSHVNIHDTSPERRKKLAQHASIDNNTQSAIVLNMTRDMKHHFESQQPSERNLHNRSGEIIISDDSINIIDQ